MAEKLIKSMLKKIDKSAPLSLISIHDEQSLEEILYAFSLIWSKDPKIMKSRKCIIGTDMLETCLNVGEIRYIVDPGYTKEKNFSSELAVEYKQLKPISKAKALKRASAVTNTYKDAKCFRLFTQKTFKSDLEEDEVAELMRSDLSIISLIFSKLKIREILSLEADVITSALELLGYIEALDEQPNPIRKT
jgi:pre-mRNA-splicing factor ATP-dependent RNA helicase DHX15/PRP43